MLSLKGKPSVKIRPIVTIVLAVLAAFASPLISAQDVGFAAQETADPILVGINLSNLQLLDIDPQQQTFEVEGYINALWYDTNLAGSSNALYQDEAAAELLKTIWWPYFEIYDSRGPRTTIHRTVAIDNNGKVVYQERFSAEIKQDLVLKAFPFDESEISFTVVPFAGGPGIVRFFPLDEADIVHRDVTWEPSDWYVDDSRVIIDEDATAWASATAYIEVRRVWLSYVFGIILPLALILVVSSAVFWMDLEKAHLGDRLGVSFTALLTVVAFDFVASDGLPNLWYTTVLDWILIGAYVAMAFTMVENVVACVLHRQGKPKLAQQVDRASRMLFPVGYVAFVAFKVLTAS